MNEDDSDSDCSDSEAEEEGSMAGPSSASKTTKPEAPEARPKSKNDLVSDLELCSPQTRAHWPVRTSKANFHDRSKTSWTIHLMTQSIAS